MSLMDAVKAQFGRPSGLLGPIVGKAMASRPSNIERSRWTISLLGIGSGDRVLEIGFGPGVAIDMISEIATEGVVVGLDHSEIMVRQASRRNADAIREGRVELRVGTVSELPDLGEPFDKVLAITRMPRSQGATNDAALESGKRNVAFLERAGFSDVRLETKHMKPVAVTCALGVKSGD